MENQIFKFSELQDGSLEFLRRFAGSMTSIEPVTFWQWLYQACNLEACCRETGKSADVSEFPKLTARDAALVRNECCVLAERIDRSTDDALVGIVAELGLKASARLHDTAEQN